MGKQINTRDNRSLLLNYVKICGIYNHKDLSIVCTLVHVPCEPNLMDITITDNTGER